MLKCSAASTSPIPSPFGNPGKTELAWLQRESYLQIYKAYCAQPSPANPTVCSDESLKKSIHKMAKAVVHP